MKIAILLISALVSYLVSGLNPAIILSRLIYKTDIRTVGSGNPGFTNFKRVFGMKYAWLVFVLDISKAIVCEVLFGLLFSKIIGKGYENIGISYSGFFCVLGHSYPVWYKFKGGKGFLVCISTLYMLSVKTGLFSTLLLVVFLLATRYMSLSTIIAMTSGAVALPFISTNIDILSEIFFASSVAFMIFRHKENIKRLLSGTESKFSFKRKRSDEKENTNQKAESESTR